MEEVLTDDEAAGTAGRSHAGFAECVACHRKWDMLDDKHRASILLLTINEEKGDQVYCGACVPPEEAPRVTEHLLKLLYEKGSENGDHVKQIAHLQKEVKSLQDQLNDQRKKSAQEHSYVLTTSTMKLRRTQDKNRLLRSFLRSIAAKSKKNATESYRKCETCASVSSKIDHELRRLRNSPDDPPSLLDRDSVHPISITDNSVVFCTVCGGLDEGDHIADLHGPKLAIVRVPAVAQDDVTLAALAVPYDLQRVALQTNGLARSS